VKRQIAGFTILMFLLPASPVYAAGPLETVKENADKVLAVLRDKNLSDEAKKEKLRAYYRQMVDEGELSRRTLGANWKKLNSAQQQEFMQLYRQVLEKAYADGIFSYDYSNAKVVVSKENMLSQNQAEVETKSVTPTQEILVTYRVILKDGAWRVYDVVIENVSLIQNYRSQFNSILAGKTPDQLIEILKNKVKG
jgi:phospholipid transport system substrate-binding protein